MVASLNVLAVVAYGVAFFLLWRDRSLRPLLLLLAGALTMLAQPVWSWLFKNPLHIRGQMLHIGRLTTLPVNTILAGGVLLAIPPLIVIYGLRHRWWRSHYATGWAFFAVFALYYAALNSLELKTSVMFFARPPLPAGRVPAVALHVLLLAGTSFGLLYAFVATRHYALRIAVLPLLLSGLGASLLFNGILASPYWVTSLLGQQSLGLGSKFPDRLQLGAAAVSIGMILWGVHLLVGGLHAGRQQQLRWH